MGNEDFMDEEAIFEMPQMLRNMAAGMMMSPPRLSPTASDEWPDPPGAGESLWSYHDPYLYVVYYELGKLAVEKSKRGKSWWAICYLLDTVIDERSMRYVTF
ncbi:hypothetical protein ACQJBY_058571 [Aegilops geniculata]